MGLLFISQILKYGFQVGFIYLLPCRFVEIVCFSFVLDSHCYYFLVFFRIHAVSSCYRKVSFEDYLIRAVASIDERESSESINEIYGE